MFDSAVHGRKIAEAVSDTPFRRNHDRAITRVTSEGKFMGGVIYQHYNGASMVMHVASWDKH